MVICFFTDVYSRWCKFLLYLINQPFSLWFQKTTEVCRANFYVNIEKLTFHRLLDCLSYWTTLTDTDFDKIAWYHWFWTEILFWTTLWTLTLIFSIYWTWIGTCLKRTLSDIYLHWIWPCYWLYFSTWSI